MEDRPTRDDLEITPDAGARAGRSRDPVAKAFTALMYMAESQESAWSARGLAAALDVPLSTAHRTLASLERAGAVERDADSSLYKLGADLQRMARILVTRFPLLDLAREQLRTLTERTGETSIFGEFDPDRFELMFVAQVEGSHPLRYVVPLHSWVPIRQAASGLSVLAYVDPELRERRLRELDLAPEALRDLQARIERVRERGYAISRGQLAAGAVGIAAPVLDHEGRVIGVIVVTTPEARILEGVEPSRIGEAVMERARELSLQLGSPVVGATPGTGTTLMR